MLFYGKESKLFWWKGTPEKIRAVHLMGFTYHEKSKMWYTQSPKIARKLYAEATAETKKMLDESLEAEKANVQASYATESESVYKTPKGLAYKPFQKAALDYILTRPNTILADEMGVGKTITAIGVINNGQNINRVLIVVPASLKAMWAERLNTWLCKFYAIGEGKKALLYRNEEFLPEILIISYSILDSNKKFLSSVLWDLLIMDEGHYAANPKAKRTISLGVIQAKKKLVMGGTLSEKNYELWWLLRFLCPASWNTFWFYTTHFCDSSFNREWRGRMKLKFDLNKNSEELNALLRSTVMIRRTKAQVLPQLPPKIKEVIPIELKNKSVTLLAHQEKRLIDKGLYIEDIPASDSIFKTLHDIGVLKIPIICEYVDYLLASNKKILIFPHHIDVGKGIADYFNKKEANTCVMSSGDTPLKKREVNKKYFIENPTCRVFVGTAGSTAEGTDGLQQVSNVIVVPEPVWSLKKNKQLEDRIHRIGQLAEHVEYHYIVVQDSLEARVMYRVLEKEKNFNIVYK